MGVSEWFKRMANRVLGPSNTVPAPSEQDPLREAVEAKLPWDLRESFWESAELPPYKPVEPLILEPESIQFDAPDEIRSADPFVRIRTKLSYIRVNDPRMHLFMTGFHGYELNEPLPESAVIEIEQRRSLELPEDYRAFLLLMGNGGAGPFHGLYRLEESLLSRDERFRESDKLPAGFGNSEHFIRLTDHTCGYGETFLVLNGEERGRVWDDYRRNDGGSLCPTGKRFLEWYETYLDYRTFEAFRAACGNEGNPGSPLKGPSTLEEIGETVGTDEEELAELVEAHGVAPVFEVGSIRAYGPAAVRWMRAMILRERFG
jgi:hypothetical protein